MFTGLIEDVGTVQGLQRREGGAVITVDTALPLQEVRVGDSIAVDGACLTVISMAGRVFAADVSPESLERTTLARARSGVKVNLERALRFGDRLGGHLVTGHVDCQARLASRSCSGNMEVLRFSLDMGSLRLLVEKGSVAIDGISLTVNRVDDEGFSVAVIPHTLKETNLGKRVAGDLVNIETDLIGKYVARLLEGREQTPAGSRLDVDFLSRHGFA